MRLRLLRVSVLQASVVIAIATAVLAALIMVPALLIMSAMMPADVVGSPFGGPAGRSGVLVMALVMPFFYAIVSFISTAILLWVFNLAAARMGGIELELAQPAADAPATGSP